MAWEPAHSWKKSITSMASTRAMESPSKYNFSDTDSSSPGTVEEEGSLLFNFVKGEDGRNTGWDPNTGVYHFQSTQEQLEGKKTTQAWVNVSEWHPGNLIFGFESLTIQQAPLDIYGLENKGFQNANAALPEMEEPCQPRKRLSLSRPAFTPQQQQQELEEYFQRVHYPDASARKELAERLGVLEEHVKVWFQNRRTKWRRQRQA